MKDWICPKCRRQRGTEDKVVMKICKVCMVEMKLLNEVEDKREVTI